MDAEFLWKSASRMMEAECSALRLDWVALGKQHAGWVSGSGGR